jgi:hypothetical protein
MLFIPFCVHYCVSLGLKELIENDVHVSGMHSLNSLVL